MHPTPAGLTAPPPRQGKLLTLEAARFIAALCVAVNHTVAFSEFVGHGTVLHGFDLPPIPPVLFFFVLSGFVIQLSHGGDTGKIERIPHYLWRRFCRIYPLYWLSICAEVYFLWSLSSPSYLWQNATLSPLTPYQFPELNPPAWSLRFEVAFYCLFGLFLLPKVRRFLIPIWILFIAWNCYPFLLGLAKLQSYITWGPGFLWHFVGEHNVLFLLGMATAWLYTRWQPPSRLLWPLLGMAGFGLLVITSLTDWGQLYPPINAEPAAGLVFAVFIFSLATLERGGHLRLNSRCAALGTMSYPLYLLHTTVTFLCGSYYIFHPAAEHKLAASIIFIGLLPVALLLAAFVAFYIDRPLQKFARRLL